MTDSIDLNLSMFGIDVYDAIVVGILIEQETKKKTK